MSNYTREVRIGKMMHLYVAKPVYMADDEMDRCDPIHVFELSPLPIEVGKVDVIEVMGAPLNVIGWHTILDLKEMKEARDQQLVLPWLNSIRLFLGFKIYSDEVFSCDFAKFGRSKLEDIRRALDRVWCTLPPMYRESDMLYLFEPRLFATVCKSIGLLPIEWRTGNDACVAFSHASQVIMDLLVTRRIKKVIAPNDFGGQVMVSAAKAGVECVSYCNIALPGQICSLTSEIVLEKNVPIMVRRSQMDYFVEKMLLMDYRAMLKSVQMKVKISGMTIAALSTDMIPSNSIHPYLKLLFSDEILVVDSYGESVDIEDNFGTESVKLMEVLDGSLSALTVVHEHFGSTVALAPKDLDIAWANSIVGPMSLYPPVALEYVSTVCEGEGDRKPVPGNGFAEVVSIALDQVEFRPDLCFVDCSKIVLGLCLQDCCQFLDRGVAGEILRCFCLVHDIAANCVKTDDLVCELCGGSSSAAKEGISPLDVPAQKCRVFCSLLSRGVDFHAGYICPHAERIDDDEIKFVTAKEFGKLVYVCSLGHRCCPNGFGRCTVCNADVEHDYGECFGCYYCSPVRHHVCGKLKSRYDLDCTGIECNCSHVNRKARKKMNGYCRDFLSDSRIKVETGSLIRYGNEELIKSIVSNDGSELHFLRGPLRLAVPVERRGRGPVLVRGDSFVRGGWRCNSDFDQVSDDQQFAYDDEHDDTGDSDIGIDPGW